MKRIHEHSCQKHGETVTSQCKSTLATKCIHQSQDLETWNWVAAAKTLPIVLLHARSHDSTSVTMVQSQEHNMQQSPDSTRTYMYIPRSTMVHTLHSLAAIRYLQGCEQQVYDTTPTPTWGIFHSLRLSSGVQCSCPRSQPVAWYYHTHVCVHTQPYLQFSLIKDLQHSKRKHVIKPLHS